jgi:hypothetical protein
MTAIKTFNVMVNNVYYPPNIGSIDDQSAIQNGISGPHDLNISSQDTDILTISAETSNSTLMPVDRISFTYNDQTGSSPFVLSVNAGQEFQIQISLEPAKWQSGSAFVTITVENQHDQSTSQYFQLEVVKEEHAPILSLIANQVVDENMSTGKITFTISDADGGQVIITGQSSNTSLVKNNKILFYHGTQVLASLISLDLNPEIPQTLYVQVTPQPDQWGACNIEIKATDHSNLLEISRFAVAINEYIPETKTYYGFVYNEYFMGVNDVQINLVEPEIQGYSTAVLTNLGTGPNGQTGDGYFELNLPVSNDIYSFNAQKTGYKSISFNTESEFIDSETENSVFFKPLYLSDCKDNQFISGSIVQSGVEPVDLYLIADDSIISRNEIRGDQFSFCVSHALIDSYTLIASIPDAYTSIVISGSTFPVNNVIIKPRPIKNIDPVKVIDGTVIITKRIIEVDPIGGQTIILDEINGTEIGIIEIPVLTNECIENIVMEYQIMRDSNFSSNLYTNGSDETIVQTNLQSQCNQFVVEMEITIENSVRLRDFRSGEYMIYVADNRSD